MARSWACRQPNAMSGWSLAFIGNASAHRTRRRGTTERGLSPWTGAPAMHGPVLPPTLNPAALALGSMTIISARLTGARRVWRVSARGSVASIFHMVARVGRTTSSPPTCARVSIIKPASLPSTSTGSRVGMATTRKTAVQNQDLRLTSDIIVGVRYLCRPGGAPGRTPGGRWR